ncbi:MAG: hypothetical protein AB2A00_20605 [Myxococcota bacterium]
MSEAMTPSWRLRERPLAPLAAVAVDGLASHLATRVLQLSDDELTALRGVAGENLLCVLGDEKQLPWIDGVTYLGRDPGAPALLLPVHHEPTVSVELFERTVLRRVASAATPLAVLHAPTRIWSLAAARPLERGRVKAWLEGGA